MDKARLPRIIPGYDYRAEFRGASGGAEREILAGGGSNVA